jgi:WD40 repeat protein
MMEKPLTGAEGSPLPPHAPEADPAATVADSEPAPPGAEPPGLRSLGELELLEEIARGGMGVVFKARHRGLNRLVAVKMILAGQLASAAEVQRFRAEAENTAQLDHPHIVPIYEVGEQDGLSYFAMKLVEGGNLACHLASFLDQPRRAAELLATVAEAVHHAHQRGILHRDLKPANILLDAEGRPHVTDFGLARAVTRPGMTQSGAILGTPSYMSPEQAAGGAQPLTTATDVFALGAILYELLAGRPPFQADSPLETLLQVVQNEPVAPSRRRAGVPRDLEIICLKCLAKEPAQRYASALALAEELRRWLRGEPLQARPVGAWERWRSWSRRRPAAAALVAVVALVTLVGFPCVAWLWWRAEGALQAEAAQRRRTQEALIQAEDAQKAESEEKRRVISNAYFHSIALAHREWLANNIERAEEILDECPAPLRHWEWVYLKRLCHADLLTIRSETPWDVTGLAFSPDGKRLATTHQDWTLVLWDAVTGQRLQTLRGYKRPGVDPIQGGFQFACAAFSPDGKCLAMANSEDRVTVWDAATGKELRTLAGHRGIVVSIAFSPDGQRLVSGGHDKTVRVWEVATGKEIRTLNVHNAAVFGVTYAPDGSRLASGGYDGTVKVWDARTGDLVRTYRVEQNVACGVAFSPDGKRLGAASWSRPTTIKVWDTATGKEVFTLRRDGLANGQLAFSPDGRRLVAGCNDSSVKVWDAASGQLVRTLRGHTGAICAGAFSPDGWRFASAANSLPDVWRRRVVELKVWDVTADPEGQTLFRLPNFVTGVAVSPDGKRVAACSGLTIGPVAMGPSQGRAQITVWDARSGEEIVRLRGQSDTFHSLAYSPDDQRLACADEDGSVQVWDLSTRREVGRLRGHTGPVSGVAYSPDGRYLGSAGQDGVVKIWQVATGAEVLRLRYGHPLACTLAFSPDGRRLATATILRGVGNAMKVWDLGTGRELWTVRDASSGIAFSPDGKLLAAVYQGRFVGVWDATTGRHVHTLRGHAKELLSVAFSSDGRRIGSAGGDNTSDGGEVAVWDAQSGQEILTLAGRGRLYSGIAFSPDDQFLVAGSTDGAVRVWDANPLPPGPLTPDILAAREVRYVAVEAPTLVHSLFQQWLLRDAVIDSLQSDPGVPDAVRARALRMARSWQVDPRRAEDPQALNGASWAVVQAPGGSLAVYRRAVRLAEAACRLKPENGNCVNTLGLGYYRAGQYQDALATLGRSEKLNRAKDGSAHPADLAFLAMAHHQLNQQKQAREILAQLRAVMKQATWSNNAEYQAFLREAGTLIENTPGEGAK